MPLTSQNIESELSYAYLHAIASKAGINCSIVNRHSDNYGTDATIDYYDNIPNTYITDVSFRVQLKATTKAIVENKGHFSYFLKEIDQYDRMRTDKGQPHRILVVLFLPDKPDEWLDCTPDQLILKKAAYWVCLYGADESDNKTGVTIYLPKANLLTPSSLIGLAQNVGMGNIPIYKKP